MNLKIDGNRCRTTSPYDVKIIRALNRLEGQKRWLKDRVFSFENTPFNREVWAQTFPTHSVEGETPLGSVLVAARDLFDVGHEDSSPRPSFAFKTPPRKHQKRALEKLTPLRACGMFLDIGCGKSWTAIAMMGKRWCEGKSDHVLLIAKNGVHEQWVKEAIPDHMSLSVHWQAWIYEPHTKRGQRAFEALLEFSGLKIFAINIDAVDTKTANVMILRFLSEAKGTATVIVDESQDIKNESAKRTEAVLKFGALSAYRIIMTGTPIAKDLTDLYSQFKFLDESIIGHRYITTYKRTYCEYIQGDHGPVLTGHKNVEDLYRRIDPFIFRITKQEALDLPPRIEIKRPFILSPEQLSAMKELKDNFFVEFGSDEKAIVKNAAGLLTRLQQISCGYLPLEDGTIRHFPNPRLEALLDILDQYDGKVAIWCRFQEDVEAIMARLHNRAVAYYGPTGKQDREANKLAFINDPGVRYFVATAATGGTGLDGLQKACWFNVYFSNSFNALDRWQSEGRTERDGTLNAVTYADLIAKKSPDSKILANLREKKSISDLTLDELRLLIESEDD